MWLIMAGGYSLEDAKEIGWNFIFAGRGDAVRAAIGKNSYQYNRVLEALFGNRIRDREARDLYRQLLVYRDAVRIN